MKSLKDLDVAGKTVFVRVDYNVPLDGGKVGDATRIEATLPTIRWILEHEGKAVLASHLGRPKGKVDPKYSLKPVASHLATLLGRDIPLAPDCIGAETKAMVDKLAGGDLLLLENLRFHAEEEANDPRFAEALASLAQVYVNDAFGAAHRAHASTHGMVKFFKDRAAGFLLAREVDVLSALLKDAKRPFVAILGGAKVSDKIGVIENLLDRVQVFCVGGAMAYTFL